MISSQATPVLLSLHEMLLPTHGMFYAFSVPVELVVILGNARVQSRI